MSSSGGPTAPMGASRRGHVELPRRSFLTGAAVLGGTAFLGACGEQSSGISTNRSAIEVDDQRGETLSFDQSVTRIVTLPMPAASIVVAVDRTAEHLVGMHDTSWVAIRDGILGTMFPDALDIPHDVAGAEFAPNVESIMALEPDVVVQWADEGSEIVAPLENAGLDVVGVTYGTQQDLETWLSLFATMLGKPERAEEMIARLESEQQEVTSLTSSASGSPPTILYFNRFADGELKVAGQGTYNDFYIDLVGGTNPASGDNGAAGTGMVGVDVEQVLAWDPDIVLLGNFDDAMPDDVYGDAVWQDVAAVRDGRVYKVPLGGYRWDPPSHESPLMWRWLSHLAFPSDEARTLREKVTEYYDFLYGQQPSDAQLDDMLWLDANRESADYQQFDAG